MFLQTAETGMTDVAPDGNVHRDSLPTEGYRKENEVRQMRTVSRMLNRHSRER